MNTKNNGGAAFPSRGGMMVYVPETARDKIEEAVKALDQQHAGMTLRDYFAASVAVNDLAVVRVREDAETLAGRSRPDGYPNGIDSIKFNMEVEAALRMMFADAMLAARGAK